MPHKVIDHQVQPSRIQRLELPDSTETMNHDGKAVKSNEEPLVELQTGGSAWFDVVMVKRAVPECPYSSHRNTDQADTKRFVDSCFHTHTSLGTAVRGNS